MQAGFWNMEAALEAGAKEEALLLPPLTILAGMLDVSAASP